MKSDAGGHADDMRACCLRNQKQSLTPDELKNDACMDEKLWIPRYRAMRKDTFLRTCSLMPSNLGSRRTLRAVTPASMSSFVRGRLSISEISDSNHPSGILV
jgi:hypothetical protein